MATSGLPQWDSDNFWSGQDFQTSARQVAEAKRTGSICSTGYGTISSATRSTLTFSRQLVNDNPGLQTSERVMLGSAWLLEVSRLFPSSPDVTFDGFDITSSNYPHPGWLPDSIRLHVWDAFSELPSEWIGAFDIVHMRAMTSTIVENKVDPLLSNAVRMLKPGGFLQWDENDPAKLACNVPDSTIGMEAGQTLVRLQQVLSRGHSKMLPDWLYGLPSTLSERNCDVVVAEAIPPKLELARALTDNYLLVWRDLIRMLPETAMPLPPNMGLPESLSRQSYAELLQKAVVETTKGASLTMPFHVTIAKKTA